jgi:orotate phosphoribosyltransferase
MTDRDDLRKLVVDLALVRGRVTLSSGQEADWYVDLRRLTLHHAGAPLVGRVMLDLVDDLEFDAVGGLTLAQVVGVAVIVDRGAEKAVRATGLSYRSAFSLADLGQ